jgi:transcriptional regulator with XRE-family HTH domain
METIEAVMKAARLAERQFGRQLREQAGLSVRQVAKDIGVDPTTLSRWERGQSRPRADAARKWMQVCAAISEHLGVSS